MNFNFWKKDKKKDTPDPKKGNPAPTESYGIQQAPNERIESPVYTDAPVVQEDQNGNDMFMGMDVTSQLDPHEGDGGDLLSNILTTPSKDEDTSSDSKFEFISPTTTEDTSYDPLKFLSTEPIVQAVEEVQSPIYMEKNSIYPNPEKKAPLLSTDPTKIDQAKPVQRMNSTTRMQPTAIKKKKKLVGEKAIGFETKKNRRIINTR